MSSPFFDGAFFGGGFFAALPTGESTGTGGGGRRSRFIGYYPEIRRLEKKKKNIEERVEALAYRVEVKQEVIDHTFEIAALQALQRQLFDIKAQLEKAIKELDEVEEQEAMLVYALAMRGR